MAAEKRSCQVKKRKKKSGFYVCACGVGSMSPLPGPRDLTYRVTRDRGTTTGHQTTQTRRSTAPTPKCAQPAKTEHNQRMPSWHNQRSQLATPNALVAQPTNSVQQCARGATNELSSATLNALVWLSDLSSAQFEVELGPNHFAPI